MKILVCVSKTPETTAKIAFKNNNTEFDESGVQYIMNPYDEWYALVRAVELVEKNGGEVVLFHVGDASSDIIIKKGLALGAERAVRVNAEPTSGYFVAKQIADYVSDNPQDIIFFGKETIDYNSSEVGSTVAEMLDLPYVSYASKLEDEGDDFILQREIEGGMQKVKVSTPFIVSAAKGMAEQKIANMIAIMKAKKKTIEVIEPTEVNEKVSISSYELPPEKTGVTLVDPEDMDELVRLLKQEAKII